MPVYNSADTVRFSVNSVLNQTYTYFDFIIVNDGSTDGTDSIIRSFKDDRIKYYVCEHKGRSAASNFGISKAETDYIARIDSDDLFFKDKLEKQVNFLKNNENVNVLFTWSIFYDKYMKLRYWKSPETDEEIKQRLLYLNPINHSTVIFKKKLAEEIMGYNESMEINEDYEFWLRLSQRAVFHCIQEYLVFTRLKINDNIKQAYNSILVKLLKENLQNSNNENNLDVYGIDGKIEYFYGDLHKARISLLKGNTIKNIKYIIMSFIPVWIQKRYRGNKFSMLFSTGIMKKREHMEILRKLLS